jgi:uncharacterized protein
MNFNVDARTILLVRHGSYAYGLNTPESDEDFKGVCIKPKEAYFGFTQRFEQMEHMGSKSDGIDKVVYSLEKFASLAADCNPNIIEVLHVADEDVVKTDAYGELLREHRDDFLSKKAKFTFSGYAHAQLKRIMTHRAWLLNPPKAPPERKDFGLSETQVVSKSELGAFDSLFNLPTVDDGATDPERITELCDTTRTVLGVELPKDVITIFTREKAFRAATAHWEQYLNWKKTRNPKRAELEAKFGYDTKHGMHLMRLEMMGNRILEKHTVQVKWVGPEREFLMSIRNGEMGYDELVERAKALESWAEELYLTSTLQKEPDRKQIDQFVVEMTSNYLRFNG